MEARRNVAMLKPGESGRVFGMNAGNKRVRRHIIDMGVTPGTQIRLLKAAPMGDPIEIELRGYSLTIRKADAEKIVLLGEDEELPERPPMEKNEGEGGDEAHHERAAQLTAFILDGEGASFCPKEAFSGGPVHIALAGNPNSGKTTLFNALTGSRGYVGNWPGVTVEKKEGKITAEGVCTEGHEMTLVDLPGIYSLSPYSMEEIVARDYIVNDKPDAIINIVDATNLERNLYLSVQLIELERPMIIALNMMDEVEKNGDRIDCKRLSLELGIPVVPISARTGMGVKELASGLQKLIEATHMQFHEGFNIEPDDVFDERTHALHHKIGELVDSYAVAAGLPCHWTQVKLIEGDERVRDALKLPEELMGKLNAMLSEYADPLADGEMTVADRRYAYVERVCAASYKRADRRATSEASERIDRVLTNKALALPLFILIMAAIFTLTFSTVGAALSDAVGGLIDEGLAPLVSSWLASAGAGDWFVSLVCDGIIKGVGGVLTFLPQIALLFFFLSLLEDSGYMSRIAFIMDKPMRRFGLSGKSFIPLLMGFGCTVPAAMSARTMDNPRDRRMTIMLTPFMSCSAKLPVYGLIAGAFFPERRGIVIFSLYALGVVLGVVSGLIFKKRLFHGPEAPFVIELPPYRWPTVKNTLTHVWERVSHFLEKAGTIILAMSVVLWFLMSFDLGLRLTEDAGESILGVLGTLIAPIFKPLGFGSWQASVALLTGVVAKEAVVSSLSMFAGFSASAGGEAVRGALGGVFTTASAYAFLVFVLLYIPCMAAVATMRRELQSRAYAAFAIIWQLVIAYGAAFVAYTFIGLFTGETGARQVFAILAVIIAIYSIYCIVTHVRHKGCCGARCRDCQKSSGCSQKRGD